MCLYLLVAMISDCEIHFGLEVIPVLVAECLRLQTEVSVERTVSVSIRTFHSPDGRSITFDSGWSTANVEICAMNRWEESAQSNKQSRC